MIATRVRARQKGVKGYRSAMRPGWLGNPYPVSDYPENPEKSLVSYRRYLWNKIGSDKKFYQRFLKLKGQDIGCTCPLNQSCHVDVIIAILDIIYQNKRQFDEYWGI